MRPLKDPPKIPEVIHRPSSIGRVNPTIIHHAPKPSIQSHNSFNDAICKESIRSNLSNRIDTSEDSEELLRSTYEESVSLAPTPRVSSKNNAKTKASRPKSTYIPSATKMNNPRKFSTKEKPKERPGEKHQPFMYQFPPQQVMPNIQVIQPQIMYPYYPYNYQYQVPNYVPQQANYAPQMPNYQFPQYPVAMNNSGYDGSYSQFVSGFQGSARNTKTPSVYAESLYSTYERPADLETNISSKSNQTVRKPKLSIDPQNPITINIKNSKVIYKDVEAPTKDLTRLNNCQVLFSEPLFTAPNFKEIVKTKEPSPDLIKRLATGEKKKVNRKDMYELTSKNYNLLPEVRHKKEEAERKESFKHRLEHGKAYEAKLDEFRRRKSSSSLSSRKE